MAGKIASQIFRVRKKSEIGKLTVQANTEKRSDERFPDKNTARIQNAISALSDMEKELDDLSSQVSEMKRKLGHFAESEADSARNEILDRVRKEAEQKLEAVRASANSEASSIVKKGETDTESLRRKISERLSDAIDLIVRTVSSA